MRCWALAEALQSGGFQVSWRGDIRVPWVGEAIKRAQWQVVAPASPQARTERAFSVDVVVVDSYSMDPSSQQALIDQGIPVVAILDDFHVHPSPASLWVNPGIPIERPEITGARYLYGIEYVLVREEIRALRAVREEVSYLSRRPASVTFLLGGTGAGALWDSIAAVRRCAEGRWDVWAGPWAAATGKDEGLLGPGPELLRRAAQSDLVVSAAGVSSWEMLHVGAPLALTLVADNQRGNYQWMASQGWAHPLGDARELMEPARLVSALSEVLGNPRSGPDTARGIIDGHGQDRVAEAIWDLIRS